MGTDWNITEFFSDFNKNMLEILSDQKKSNYNLYFQSDKSSLKMSENENTVKREVRRKILS